MLDLTLKCPDLPVGEVTSWSMLYRQGRSPSMFWTSVCGNLVKIPGMPPMYDYEWWPQEIVGYCTPASYTSEQCYRRVMTRATRQRSGQVSDSYARAQARSSSPTRKYGNFFPTFRSSAATSSPEPLSRPPRPSPPTLTSSPTSTSLPPTTSSSPKVDVSLVPTRLQSWKLAYQAPRRPSATTLTKRTSWSRTRTEP